MRKLFCMFICMVSACAMYSQSTATASIAGTIVSAVSTEKISDFTVETIATQSNPATLSMTASGNNTVDVSSAQSFVHAGSFRIFSTTAFDVSLANIPSKVIHQNGQRSMQLRTAISTRYNNDEGWIVLGATLHMQPNQLAGSYRAEKPISITVNFN